MSLTSKVLVTGGAGFIGSNLADALIREGARVTIIDNFATGFRENLDEISGSFEFIEGDITDIDTVEKAVQGVEVVFHEAALPSVPRSVDDPAVTQPICVDGSFILLLYSYVAGV
ncbi:MAG: SDR family NAD(P)-dependent oxidoreductase [Pyrinomonadaceae bacterium]